MKWLLTVLIIALILKINEVITLGEQVIISILALIWQFIINIKK